MVIPETAVKRAATCREAVDLSSSKKPIPAAFTTKKAKILEALSVPNESYTDLSPKGSVDEGIRELISSINTLDGVVTTSSCAGRISVFLEGKKTLPGSYDEEVGGDDKIMKAVPGGKGLGGRWLYVSHEPVLSSTISFLESKHKGLIYELFQLKSKPSNVDALEDIQGARYVKFQFEPMILHIMTASLHHARKVLSAAIDAGFRESGVQSLKALDDPNAFPMVAVRSAGLALSSIIGFASNGNNMNETPTPLVSEEYLRILLVTGNERFKSNAERINRFRTNLLESKGDQTGEWEDEKVRAERKRAEGLKEQERARHQKQDRLTETYPSTSDGIQEETALEGLEMMES